MSSLIHYTFSFPVHKFKREYNTELSGSVEQVDDAMYMCTVSVLCTEYGLYKVMQKIKMKKDEMAVRDK